MFDVLTKWVTGLSFKTWVYVFAFLCVLGGVWWFWHQIDQAQETERQLIVQVAQNTQLKAVIENSEETKRGREKTDEEINKMSNDAVIHYLDSNGWLYD